MARNTGVVRGQVPARVFVGRERELRELRGGLDEALAGRSRIFLIVGEPGIGKTRLANELATDAAAHGAHVLWGRCWEDGGAPAYWPWIQVLRGLIRTGDPAALAADMGTGAARIAQLLPEIREQLPNLPAALTASPINPDENRFPLFDATTTFLLRTAVHQPLVIVLDDLHAADMPTLLLLQFVARALRDAPILLIGTYRAIEAQQAPERGQLLGAVARYGHCLPLAGLNAEDVARLIEDVAAVTPPAGLVTAVHRITEGNPFFVDEVARLLIADPAPLPADLAAGDLAIPHGVREAIRERLRPLSDECRHILTIAAVIGREWDLPCLQAACELSTERLLDTLNEAVAAGIVTAVPAALSRYGFTHALIRETLYEEMSAMPRLRLHQRIGEALEQLSGRDTEVRIAELAHHFYQAAPGGTVEKALDYATRAGQSAAEQLAYEDAAAHFERALHALTLIAAPNEQRQADLLLALGDVQRASSSPLALETFQRAAELSRRLARRAPQQAAQLLARAALGFADRGLGLPQLAPDPAIVTLIEEALAALSDSDDPLRARLLGRLGMELSFQEQSERSGRLSEAAVEMARRLGDPMTLAVTLTARHFVLWTLENIHDRLRIAAEIIRLAERQGNKELALQGRSWRLVDLMDVGDVRTFDAEIEVQARTAEELRQPRYLWVTTAFRAMRALWRGQWKQAEVFAQQALAIGEQTADPWASASPWIQLFVARREQGQLAQEELMAQLFVERFPASPMPRTFLATIYAETGRDDQARAAFERLAAQDFVDLKRERRVGALPYLSDLCARFGDARRAALLYELLLPFADSTIPYGGVVCFGAGVHYLAVLAATMARWELAVQLFEKALDRHTRTEGWPWLARTQYEYARLLLGVPASQSADTPAPATVDRTKGRQLLRAALDSAQGLGMVGLAEKAHALETAIQSDEASHAAQPRVRETPRARAYGTDGTTQVAPASEEAAETTHPNRGGRVLRFPAKKRDGDARPDGPKPTPLNSSGAVDRRTAASSQDGLFQLDGDYWSVGDGNTVLRLKDSKGLRYIAQLLRHPKQDIHVTDLVATDQPVSTGAAHIERMSDRQLRELGMQRGDPTAAAEVLDAQAKAAYKRRLEDLRDQLEEARRFNDVERAARAQQEIDFLSQELASAVGLGGRDRTTSAHAERARLNVTRAIKAVVKRISRRNPDLGHYLKTTIKTGAFCSYAPDPRVPINWKL